MPATIFHMDSANLFVGDDDPTNSQFLVIKDIKLPTQEEETKEHKGGGAAATVELGLRHFMPFTLGFNLEGYTPDVINKFMASGAAQLRYTVRGNIRDVRTHKDIELKAIIGGRMTKADIGEFKRDDGIGTEYEIKEVMFYQRFFDGNEEFYFDYFAGMAGVRIDGLPKFGDVARNLGLA